MPTEGFSIVICCYNSSARLPATLRHIASLIIPRTMLCELLIINNGSTDATQATVVKEWARYTTAISLSIINEPEPGLSNARKKGFEAAKYDYVVWCDDDNWLDKDYLLVAKRIFAKRSNIGVIGGRGKIHCVGPCPEWLQYDNLFAVGKQGTRSGPVKSNRVYGAGAIIYKPAYEMIVSVGFRQLLTDRIGTKLGSGGDYEICHAIALAGYTIWYEENLRFTHYIPPFRLTKSYYIQLIRESVICLPALDAYKILLTGNSLNNKFAFWKYTCKHFFYFTKELFRFLIKRLASNPDTGYGFYIRARTRFFLMRIHGLVSDSKRIYVNTKRLERLEERLQALKPVKPPGVIVLQKHLVLQPLRRHHGRK